MLGNLLEEAATLIPYLSTTNITLAIEAADLDPQGYYSYPNLFPLPSGPNTTLNIFNLTSHLATDSGLRCLDQALAYAAAHNGISESVWYYEFSRSYQPTTFDIQPLCNPPVTPGYPYGDPSGIYFR
jgi:hypothetical protein